MWIERTISDKIRRLIQSFPAVILSGARQTGKTSLLRRLFPEYRYVSLDLRVLAEQAEESPNSFLEENLPPLIIDEVQYAPGLFRSLKIAIDNQRELKGQFIITGSQKFNLMREVSDSLAGRCALLSLPGLSLQEMKSTGWKPEGTQSQCEMLVRGTFPELWADPQIPTKEFYQSYVSTYLERDLRQLLNVGNLRDFERFLRACAARSSQLLNKSELARDVGISQTTASEWVSVLEASNQITLLEPFFANIGKRLVKSPKLYLNDTGLLCFLLGHTPDALSDSPLIGAIWENFVFSELSKWLMLNRPEWSIWFYRDQQNREADFLIQGPYHQIRIMDAKWSEMPSPKSFATQEIIANNLIKAEGITNVELAIAGRMEGVRQIGENRYLLSAFELPRFLDKLTTQ